MDERVAELWADLAGPLRAGFSRDARPGTDPDDLLQETFLRVTRGIDTVRDEDRLVPWVRGIARHVVTDSWRDRPMPSAPEVDVPAEEHGEDVGELVARWIAARIEQLPEPYGEALRLFELEGLPQAEIAERLGVSLGTVKTRVHRGRASVREDLLACCAFEFDARGRVVDWRKRDEDGGDCGSC